MNPYIISDTHITVIFEDGTQLITAKQDSPERFDEIIRAITQDQWDKVKELMSIQERLQNTLANLSLTDKIKVTDNEIYYNGEVMHNAITSRLLQMIQDLQSSVITSSIRALALFLDNLMQNSSFHAVEELYLFLEQCELPITEDGHFIAYKRVRSDYKDLFSGTIDNSVGSIVTMDRNQVNDNRNDVCSKGLHFCSAAYLPNYRAGDATSRIVLLKINPKDVVSIPSDYNNSKGRCCKYEVIQDVTSLYKDNIMTQTIEQKPIFHSSDVYNYRLDDENDVSIYFG